MTSFTLHYLNPKASIGLVSELERTLASFTSLYPRFISSFNSPTNILRDEYGYPDDHRLLLGSINTGIYWNGVPVGGVYGIEDIAGHISHIMDPDNYPELTGRRN